MSSQADVPTSLQSPYPPLTGQPTAERPVHVLLASTGSVASVKVPLIVESLMGFEHVCVQVIATTSSLAFYDKQKINTQYSSPDYGVKALANENMSARTGKMRAHVWTDEDEWSTWSKVGDPILHIELRRWADIVLVAPCSANTLAKLNAGICDSLLTSFMRALSPSTPTYLFPAMNTLMYLHPLTAKHLEFVQHTLGYLVHGPITKRLACGDLGTGAMQEWSDIVQLVVEHFDLQHKPSLESVLAT